MWSIIRLWAYRVNGERVGLRVRFRSLEQSCLWWGEKPYRERNVQNGRIPRTDCASETVCGILPSDQKRSNFLTSCVKLAQMEPEKLHLRSRRYVDVPIWAHSFRGFLKGFSGPHLESWQRMRPLFLRCESNSEGVTKESENGTGEKAHERAEGDDVDHNWVCGCDLNRGIFCCVVFKYSLVKRQMVRASGGVLTTIIHH